MGATLYLLNPFEKVQRLSFIHPIFTKMIGETIASENQGKVYGSHFAFSHLWWAIAYPIAGFLGSNFPKSEFLYGGILTISLGIIAIIIFKPSFNFQNK